MWQPRCLALLMSLGRDRWYPLGLTHYMNGSAQQLISHLAKFHEHERLVWNIQSKLAGIYKLLDWPARVDQSFGTDARQQCRRAR